MPNNNLFKIHKKIDGQVFTLILLYTFAHIGILTIMPAIYWDDWTLFRTDPSVILETFNQAGAILGWTGFLHIYLLSLGPWIYKLLTFFLMLGSGLALYGILGEEKNLNKYCRFFITLFFLVLPLDSARVALINLPSNLCYFLFFLAWLLIRKSKKTSLILFLISFNVNSLLVFYLAPIVALWRSYNIRFNFENIIYFFKENILFMIIPFIYFFIKNTYFKPYGLYTGYNQNYRPENILKAFLNSASDFKIYIISFDNFFFTVLIFLLILTITITVFKKSKIIGINLSNPQRLHILLAGGFLTLAGIFPYWILGLPPTFYEWSSRHQLLMPLGVSLLLVGSLSKFKNNLFFSAIASSMFITANINVYTSLYLDWDKQMQLINAFSKNEVIRMASLIVIDDKTKGNNALKRTYRFYEWNGMLELAFNDEKRFGIAPSEIKYYLNEVPEYYFDPAFKASDHVREDNSLAAYVEITNLKDEKISSKIFIPNYSIVVRPFKPN